MLYDVALSEVREFSKGSNSHSFVCLFGEFWRRICGGDTSHPIASSFIKEHALYATAVSFIYSSIRVVLGMCCYAKIAASIIQSIVIDVIDNALVALFESQYCAVHPNRPSFSFSSSSIPVTFGVSIASIVWMWNPPIPLIQPLKIRSIDDSEHALTQRDVSDRWVIRLLDWLSYQARFCVRLMALTVKYGPPCDVSKLSLCLFGNRGFLAASALAEARRYTCFGRGHSRAPIAMRIRPTLITSDPSILSLEAAR